jgi:hypothetical protein
MSAKRNTQVWGKLGCGGTLKRQKAKAEGKKLKMVLSLSLEPSALAA